VTPARSLPSLARLLADTGDLIEGRVSDPNVPGWARARGWEQWLLGLADGDLARAEALGLARAVDAGIGEEAAPATLGALCSRVRAATDLGPEPPLPDARVLRGASPRKRAQVAALVALVERSLPSPERIVDVGSGHGHLTRELAEALGVEAVGVERDDARVLRARALSTEGGPTYEVQDAARDPLDLRPGNLVVGLHACGELGDALVEAAAARAVDVLLVSCCLQKVRGKARQPISEVGRREGLVLPRPLLGLTNLASRHYGVEAPMPEIMQARATRYALRLLLRARGVHVAPGEEARGINRRRMSKGLRPVAEAAFARRGLAPPTEEELAGITERAHEEFGRVRRLSLPRSMLGRVVELAVVVDRASALAEAGHAVEVVPAFAAELSPRNLAIVGRAPRGDGA